MNSDKWNQLEHEKLEDLVFVRYNRAFENRWKKDVVCDPISLEDIDYCNEWLIVQMEEEQDNDSMSNDVAYASLDDEEEADEEEFACSNDLEDEFLLAWFAARDEDDDWF